MSATMTIEQKTNEAIKQVQQAPADEGKRITRRIEIGHCVHQGDVYVHRVDDTHKRGKQIGKDSVQIALGVGNGARHVAEGSVEVYQGVQLPEWVNPPMDVDAAEITGPLIVSDKAFCVTHPEHADHQLPGGTYQVTYQYDPKTMRRVAD